MRNRSHPAGRLSLAIAIFALMLAAAGAPSTGARPAATGGATASAGRQLYLPLLRNSEPAPAPVIADLNIRPVPQREVQRGSTLSVEYRFRNDDQRATTARLSLIFPSRLMGFTRLDAPSDRLISHDATHVVVEVRNVAAGATRTGRINFLVFADAAIGSRIGLFAEYACQAGATCRSNLAEVEVIRNGEEGASGGTFTMTVAPDRGPPGTAHTFSGSRFRPGEAFVTWLNTPSGVQPLPITGRADSLGRVQFTFGSGGITQAGFYSLVAHGQQSEVQNVGPFIVQIGGRPGIVAATPSLTPVGPSAPAAAELMAAPAATAGKGGIAGRILNSAGAGVAEVAVEVLGASGELAAVARSRADGTYFVASGLATGQYTVVARPATNPDLALLASASAGPVAVTAPDLTSGVNLTLPAAGGLSGVVKGGAAGLGGVVVAALNAGGAIAAYDISDPTGVYTVTNLPAGPYTLSFDPGGAAREGLYAKGLLSGQTVTAGQIGAVGDFTLPASGTSGVIAGRVTDATSGTGIGDVLVVITGVGTPESPGIVSVARTEGDGSYASDPLPAGSYRAQFVTAFSELAATARYSGEFFDDAASFAESDLLTVTAGQQTTADAGLALGASIAGTLTGAGVGPLAEVLVAAFDGDGVPRAIDLSDAAGAYALPGLRAGSYTVRAFPSLSPNSAARPFVDGGYDTTPATPDLTSVALAAGAALTGIDIQLGQGAQIVGSVSAGDTGQPLGGVIVAFIRNPATAPALAGVSVTDAEGRYSSPGLAAGSYTIFFTTVLAADATTRTYQSEFFNNRTSLATADPILVGGPGSSLTRNVDLSRGGSVSGRVSGADSGAGLGGVLVVASIGEAVVGAAVTDEAGAYRLVGLPAGLIALSFEPDFSPDPAVRAYANRDLSITLAAGSDSTADVALELDT